MSEECCAAKLFSAPAQSMFAENGALLREALLLEHRGRAVGLHEAHVRRGEQVATEVERTEACGASDDRENGVH